MPVQLRQIAPGVHVAQAPQRFMGLELGARMTALELDTGLLLHSPLAFDPALVAHLGQPRWVLAPNLFHHLYVGPWIEAGAQGWAAPGLAHKRADVRFDGELDSTSHPFGPQLQVLPLRCLSLTREVVVLHRPSGTLLVTDLVFNLPSSAPALTRAAMRCLCGYPGCRSTLVERAAMQRAAAREDLQTLLSWPFERLIMAHGEVIERGGPAALREAFKWLWR